MSAPRTACCLDSTRRPPCGTRWLELRAWACGLTGKGVSLVTLEGAEQGRAPFYAQPVGYDGRSFRIAFDHGCDTEKLLHEVCHWVLAPRERRTRLNYGMGPGHQTQIPQAESDNEEVTTMLLEQLLAPCFALSPARLARPDYNVASRRNVDRDACRSRAEAAFQELLPGLRAINCINCINCSP